jgi:hypothetical protein
MLRKVLNGYSVKLGGNAVRNKMIKPNTPVNFGHKTDFLLRAATERQL